MANLGSHSQGLSLRNFLFFLSCLCCVSVMVQSLDRARVYMEASCGSTHSFSTSYLLDSSTGLMYLNQQDCTYTAQALPGYFVVAVITRFDLEGKLTGSCVDYLDVHDGIDTSATKLNSEPVCGTGSSIPGNFTASGQAMTLHFVTDNNGVYLGFSINFVAATNGLCAASQYSCNTSICIDSSLECDSHNQCGDSSDEENCPESSASSALDIVLIVIIVLITIAVVALIIGFIAYKIHARNQWKKFLHAHIDDDDGIIEPGPSYPITHRYYKGIRGNPAIYTNNVIVAGTNSSSGNKNVAFDFDKDKPNLEKGISDIPSVSSVRT